MRPDCELYSVAVFSRWGAEFLDPWFEAEVEVVLEFSSDVCGGEAEGDVDESVWGARPEVDWAVVVG